MRHLKTLTLAAMAVFALVAFAGAGAASATRLCNANPSPGTTCPAANIIPSGTVINSSLPSAGTVVLAMSGGLINPTMTCSGSTTSITTTSAGGGTAVDVTGSLTDFGFSSCTSSGATCNTSATVGNGRVTGLPTSGSVSYTTGVDGSLTLTAPLVNFTCTTVFFPMNCFFGGNPITGTVTGGNPAQITFYNVTIGIAAGSDPTCPTQARWTATYAAQSPMSAIWVTDS